MVQSKVINDDDIVSVLYYVDENISEVECDNEIHDNQDSELKSGRKASPVVSR
jgi:hypothetical protein